MRTIPSGYQTLKVWPDVFADNGYHTYCAGKIFHHQGRVFQAYEIFDEYLPFPATMPPDSPMPEQNLLVPMIKGSHQTMGLPAIATYGMNNLAVRSETYRYIRLADGTEELYHTVSDIHEWANLAGDPVYRSLMDSLSVWIPAKNAGPVPDAERESR